MKNIYLKFIYRVLAFYARKVIKKHNPIIVAITGSVGKTTTKEAVYQVLKDTFPGKVWKNEGNLNAEIGIPLTILGYTKLPNKFFWPIFLIKAFFRTRLKKYPKYLVLEMGVEKKGDLKYFTSIFKPTYLIITSVGLAHLSNFSDPKEYQAEKLSILDEVVDGGKILLNYDDPILLKITKTNIVSVATKNLRADYYAEDIKVTSDGTIFRVCRSGCRIIVKSKLLGSHLINSSIFAFAIADIMELALIKVAKSLEQIKAYPGRMNLISGINETKIIDDSYNANPQSVEAALITMSEIDHKGRKVLILGNMNELGSMEKRAHENIGAFAKNRCDLAVFVGKNAEIMQKGYADNKTSLTYKDKKELIVNLDNIIKKGDLILIKASQNNCYFEEIVKSLMQFPDKADKLLVRQSKFWLKKKK